MSKNVSIETITHNDQSAQQSEQVNESPLDVITAAVNVQLDKNNETLLKKMEEKSDMTIKEAVKKALEKGWPGASTSKKPKKEPEFNGKGNKIRYEVNEEVIERIDAAIEALDGKELETAKKEMEAGKAILTKQQKLIRIADREEHGWEVVKHYLSDDLADDSSDEKDINRARKEALASITKRKAKRKVPFRNAPQPRVQKFKQDEHGSRGWETNRARNWDAGRAAYDKAAYERRKIICYQCGREGHLQYNCNRSYTRGTR